MEVLHSFWGKGKWHTWNVYTSVKINLVIMNILSSFSRLAKSGIKHIPHLLFIPGWVWFIYMFDRLMDVKIGWDSISGPLSYTESPLGPVAFVYALGYFVVTMHMLSVAMLIKRDGKPYWATTLHILFVLLILIVQFIVFAAGQGMKGFQL